MKKIDPNDRRRRPFQQIADDLRNRINKGEWAPGQVMPTIKALSGEYEVAGQTVQSAMRVLKEENIVVSEPARGFYVRDPSQPESSADSAQPADLAAVKSELSELQERVTAIEGDNARLEALIMDLYGRTGQPYPHETPKGATRRERTG
jgi:DNA-binding GntR family transcriptional regulator